MKFPSRRLGIVVAATATSLLTAVLPAAANDFVQDQAGMFSAGTVAQLNEQIGNFNTTSGKAIVVITTPSLRGATLQSATQSAFLQQTINGVLIFVARDDRRDIILPDRSGAQAGWFAPSVVREIRLAIAPNQGPLPASQGGHVPMFWWVIIAVVGFLILRSIMRASAASRYYGGPAAPPGAAPPGEAPGAGYGAGPGYGYGGFGGGGSFWSGLLGGLGGAWLGNELFRGGGGAIAPTEAGQVEPDAGDSGGAGDLGGGGGDSGGGW